jgi:hypothetical protein
VDIQPPFDVVQELPTTFGRRYPDDFESTAPVSRTEVPEAQKVEAWLLSRSDFGRAAERQQAGLLFRDLETKLAQPLFHGRCESFDLSVSLKTCHKIVCEAHEMGGSFTSTLHPFLKPKVNYVVKIDVGQARRNGPALRRTLLRPDQDSIAERTGPQPLPDESQDGRVFDFDPKHLHEPPVIQVIEESPYVSLKDPVHPASH